MTPASLLNVASNLAPILHSVASPSAFLREKTVGSFPRPEVPGRAGRDSSSPSRIDPGLTPAALGGMASNVPGLRPSDNSSGSAAGSNTSTGVRELTFDADSTSAMGDLGRFLAESVQRTDKLVRVRVRGRLAAPWTPVRLPQGVSLEVIVEPDRDGTVPSWSVAKTGQGEALIDVRGGNLSLTNVRISREGSTRPKYLIRVESGHLSLTRCRLTSPGAAPEGGGGLIGFFAPGSRPLSLSDKTPSPFEKAYDRPVCQITDTVLITGGDVLTAELGRGLVALTQCAVAADRTVFALAPSRVARDRFEADLSLSHCTIAAAGNVVALGPWPGGEPGPDRPWLVTSENCGFFGSYERTARDRESVMLRTDPVAFAHGVLFWQSLDDVFRAARVLLSAATAPFRRIAAPT